MDFFSEKELTTQTGHAIDEWPLVVVKELIDNALDACEDVGVAPVIEVEADPAGITVRDNGPGLPEETLKGQMDFSVRVSNRELYCAPDRGRQGNALKTLLPMPWVIDPEHGKIIITAHGKRHEITCGADPISQRPVIRDDVSEVGKSKNSRFRSNGKSKVYRGGTEVRLEWRPLEEVEDVVWPFDGLLPCDEYSGFANQFRSLVEGFAIFNPHATIRLDWFGEKTTWKATDSAWKKWRPSQSKFARAKPHSSAHWYELRHFERLIGGYLTHDVDAGIDDRLVSDLIAGFEGLTGSAKRSKVLDDCDLRRAKIAELILGDRFDSERIAKLLEAMQKHTRPVNPRRLGLIGEPHLKARLLAMGVREESFRYSRRLSKEGVPWVLESAFGWKGNDSEDTRSIFAGANWSAAIKNPFRSFGSTGEGLEATLTDLKAGRHEPIVFVLHLAHPRVEYTDRGKSALVIGGAADD